MGREHTWGDESVDGDDTEIKINIFVFETFT